LRIVIHHLAKGLHAGSQAKQLEARRHVRQGLELQRSRRNGSGCSRPIHGVAFLCGISPRAYRLKASNAASPISTSIGTIPLHYGAEKSARRVDNLTAIAHFVARLDVLPFEAKAAAHYGQVRAELERAGTPCGPHDIQIGGHARSEGLIIVTDNIREFDRMPGIRAENWV
jgi:tRNA(fMet)-specific endonuclease VapC